jgi:hypothetical protein
MAKKTNEEILEAVRSLDPQNDEHWTADGQPRLDAVENKLGGDVSRKDVTNAAPDFTRTVARELVDVDDDGEPPIDEPPVDQDEVPSDQDEVPSDQGEVPSDQDETPSDQDEVPSDQDEVPSDQDDPQSPGDDDPTDKDTVNNGRDDEDDPLAEGPADVEAAMDEEILAQQELIKRIQEGLAEGRVMLEAAEADLARMVDAKNREFPPLTPAEAIKQFQRNELAKRVEARGAGRALSPLDTAMRASRKPRARTTMLDGTKKPE